MMSLSCCGWISWMLFIVVGNTSRRCSGFTTSTSSIVVSPNQHRHHYTTTATTTSCCWEKKKDDSTDDNNDPDLFEYFDPLLSPHAYPNGISPDQKPIIRDDGAPTPPPPQRQQQDPLRLNKPAGYLKRDPVDQQVSNNNDLDIDTDTVFDPTLSPHLYGKGRTPDTVRGDEKATISSSSPSTSDTNGVDDNGQQVIVGILLMDHGSRNEESNKRLHEMAKVYEQSLLSTTSSSSGTRIVVRAAHMEIATPTIQDGIESLINAGVNSEIICHPYFLNPYGRHAQDDVPRLIDEACTNLQIDDSSSQIKVKTTNPVGSNMDVMINAIHTFVENTSSVLDSSGQQGQNQNQQKWSKIS